MLQQVHAPEITQHPHVQKTCKRAPWLEGKLTIMVKPQTSHVAREIINPTAAKTNNGREKAGHFFQRWQRKCDASCLNNFLLANARECHQTSGTLKKKKSPTSTMDLQLSSYCRDEAQHLQTPALQRVSSVPISTAGQGSPLG